MKEIRTLLLKEIILEWRQKYALNGILLYLTSTIFICYMSFSLDNGQINPPTWNALLWIILLFTAVNAISKGFNQEKEGRMIYYYCIASPRSIIVSKIIYNTFLMMILALPGYLIYSLVLGNPVFNEGLFILNLFLGALGFSSTLTMVSGIASKAGNNITLMAILSFPVIIPMLLLLIRTSGNAMNGLGWSHSSGSMAVLLSINAIVITVSYLLFPYLWRS
jgi:heme exporter protein B